MQKQRGFLFLLLFASLPALGQETFGAAALFGGAFGGVIKLGQEGFLNRDASIANTFAWGLAAGFRFDGDTFEGDECLNCNAVEFRWMWQPDTHLSAASPSNLIPAFRPSLSVNRFVVDFTHEFEIEDYPIVRPFLTLSLGAARLGVPQSAFTRFAWGLGTGVKLFPKPHWGFRVQVEYAPIVVHASVQNVLCVGGACVVALGGGMINQFLASAGPEFHF
jgi:hypothetical protein